MAGPGSGDQDFAGYLQLQGLQEAVVKSLQVKGCDNEQVLAALTPEDVASLGAPTLQQSLLLQLCKAASQQVQFSSPLELTNRAEFEPYLRSQGLSQHTVDCLKKEGCDNLMVLKNIPNVDIDKCEEIKPFQRSLLKAIMPKVRPKGKPKVSTQTEEPDAKHVRITKTQVIADNIQEGSDVEGVVHHSISGKTLNIDTVYIDAKNVAPGSRVTGVRVVSSHSHPPVTIPASAMPASSGFKPFPESAQATFSSTFGPPHFPAPPHFPPFAPSPAPQSAPQPAPQSAPQRAPQPTPQPAPRPAPQSVPQSNRQAGARPEQGFEIPFSQLPFSIGTYKEMPDVARMVDGTRTIKVLPASKEFFTRLHGHQQVYKISRQSRGRCVLYNSQEERPGSAVDSNKLAHLFSQLHFDIRKENTPRIVDIRKHLVRYREYCLRLDEKPECLILGFLCKCSPEGVVAPNEEVLPYQEIYDQFQGEIAAGLEGIPKIFIFHGPRTKSKQERLLLMTEEKSDRPRPGKDMIAIFPTNEAYNSWTNTTYGTWFIEGFSRIFEEFACTDDLDALLIKINDLVSRRVSVNAQEMMVDTDSKLTKKLYFFPSCAFVSD